MGKCTRLHVIMRYMIAKYIKVLHDIISPESNNSYSLCSFHFQEVLQNNELDVIIYWIF
jgi:hypothetical protein